MIPCNRAFNQKSFYEHEGKTYYRYRIIAEEGEHLLRFRFLHVDSPYKQGIVFTLSREFKGKLFLNGKRLAKPRRASESLLVVEEGSFPDNTFELKMLVESGSVLISSASDLLGDYPSLRNLPVMKDKDMEAMRSYVSGFTAGAYGDSANAFWIEEAAENRFIYHCNDHAKDDDFDDMLFEIEVMGS